MVTLMMVFRSSMANEVDGVLRKSGISAYTLIKNAEGKGETGNVVGSFLYPGTNSIIFAILPDDQVDLTIDTLKTFHTERLEHSHGQPIPFKLFSFPCRELI
jgi:nitrogen regulatory protein PII